MNPRGIYVHIPFCKQKCYYCDFLSYADKTEKVEEYINALEKEIVLNLENSKNEIDTIYIGGGTPSNIESSYIEQIVKCIYKYAPKEKIKEITIEVNPGTVTKEKLEKYAELGINRLSIGLQTSNDELLKKIGRIHTYNEFLQTYNMAKEVGFTNINVDVIIGLPSQTLEDVLQTIDNLISLDITHVSVYSLIVEDETKLKELIETKEYILPTEIEERQMYWEVKRKLEQNKFFQYEISNYAKTKKESLHNINCWKQHEYYGFGLAAHSYIGAQRYSNSSNLEEYIKNINEGKLNKIVHETQTKQEMQNEYMMLGLRLIDGINIEEFKEKFLEDPLVAFKDSLGLLQKQELIKIDESKISLTNKGLDLANIVWGEFV